MAAYALAPLAQFNGFLLETKLHPTYLPYALLPTLHAARISIVHRALKAKAAKQTANDAKGDQGKTPPPPPPTTWAYDITAFLIMSWGGGILASFLLGQTPVQFLSVHPFVHYVGVHLFLTFLFAFVVAAPTAKFLDSALILVDGALRTHAVIMSVTMARTSSVGAVQNSLLLQIICGTIGATGGGQLAGTLSVESPYGWRLQTPPALRATRLVEVIDIIAAAVCAIVFGATTLSHPDYRPLLAVVHTGNKPLLSPTGARALCTLVFATAFAYRATVLHWTSPSGAAQGSASSKPSKQRGGDGVTRKPSSKRATK